MSELVVLGQKDATKAEEKRRLLQDRGFTVTVFTGDNVTVDTTNLDGGSVATGSNAWVVVGTKK